MYSSIDRVDVIAQSEDKKKVMCLQTDHRSSLEMEQDPEHTIVFAITRTALARYIIETDYPDKEHEIIFEHAQNPWQKKVDIVTSMGATARSKDVVLKGKKMDVEKELNKTMASLAEKYAKKHKLKFTLADLEKAENKILEKPPQGNIEMGTEAVDLAAFAGKVISNTIGGEWITFYKPIGTAYVVGAKKENKQYISPTNRAMKLIVNGKEDSVALLVEAVTKGLDNTPALRTKNIEKPKKNKELSSKNDARVDLEEPKSKEKIQETPKKKGFFQRIFGK